MPRPNISVPRPDESFYAKTFGRNKPGSAILIVTLVLISLIAGSMNSVATVISCTSVIIAVVALLAKGKALEA